MKRNLFFLGFLLIFFNSCSKDDNPNPPEVTAGTLQGIFVDSPVEGLRYETETHSGLTDENGTYDYKEGETVTFYVGDIKLGSAEATGELSPISIASTSDATIETQEVQNIVAFLQTLDIDADPSNGIYIDPEIVEALSISNIDFTQPIFQILGESVLEIFQKTGKELSVVFPERATIHLAQTLGVEFEPIASFSLNFLPTFTNYYSQDNKAVNWIHEFDEEGRLVKSSKYEKYPSRIKSEYRFTDYDEENLTVNLNITTHDYRTPNTTEFQSYKITYSQEFFMKKITFFNNENQSTKDYEFSEMNENGWVENINILSPDQMGMGKINYEYNGIGFITKIRNYDSSGVLGTAFERTATEFGEIKTDLRTSDNAWSFEYFYRSDHTLEREEWIVELPNFKTHTTYEFDENEALLKDTVKYGNNLEDTTIDTYDAGVQTLFEWFMDGVIYQISYFEPDGNGGSFLYKIENYGNDGELDFTTFYDEEGNVTHTEYV